MILEKRRGRWWVYLDPDSTVESDLLDGIFDHNGRNQNRIFVWLRDNVAGRWNTGRKIYYRKGDYRQFITVRFSNHEDAMMFIIAFEQQPPRVQAIYPDWKQWSESEQANPVAMTFEPWANNSYYYEGERNKQGELSIFRWSTSRNKAGKYLSWKERNGQILHESVRAFSKRKDAASLALKRCEKLTLE